MVLRGKVTTEKLKNIYDTINRIIENQNCYYRDEEIQNIKKDNKNIFLAKSQGKPSSFFIIQITIFTLFLYGCYTQY